MRNNLTPFDIANNVRMTRTLHKGAILIVEGTTDIRVYERFLSKTKCKFIPAHGKDNAIGALSILEKKGFKGILTIIDADFWRLDGIKPKTPNLFLTDTHDLETIIISSDAFDKILNEFGSVNKIKKLNKPIREMLLESGIPIGFLRWISSPNKENISLFFKNLSFYKFVDKKTLEVDIDNLIKEVKFNSNNSTLDENLIKKQLIILMKSEYDPWQVCSGHDLVQILSIGFLNIFGNHRGKETTPEVVDGLLRISFEFSHFCLTDLYKSIVDWEKLNQSFEILN
ncbi:MAG: DUF4435 domain-containing protein [Methanosarcinales archaeon]|nr:DUF4435 domain-containing protein [Methanosarcinales archaeon]